MAAEQITYNDFEGAVKRGNVTLAFRHGWLMPDGTKPKFWFRGSDSMAPAECKAVVEAILTSPATISGPELAAKIHNLLS